MSVRTHIEPLTKRQREVLDLLVRGRTNYEIAQHLGISLDGAKWHVREVLARLGVDSREAAAEVWRRERSWTARAFGSLSSLAVGWKATISVAAAALTVVAVAGAVYLGRGDDATPADADPTVGPGTTPTPGAGLDEFAPRSGIPIVDEVVGIVAAGELPAFRALMKEFPEPCSTAPAGVGSPLPCPPGAPTGTMVQAFRALASERAYPGADLDQVLENTVPKLTTLHGVASAQPDTFNAFFPPWKYEVIAYGPAVGGGQGWAFYLLDDTGIVGVYVPQGFGGTNRRDGIPPEDWLIAPYSLPRFAPEKSLYVFGQDSQVNFVAELPPACEGKTLAIRLYDYPPPGVAGGIQSTKEPGLMTEARAVGAGNNSDTIITFRLPPSISGPMRVRPGLLSPCLSQIAVQGELNLALLAPPGDEGVATFEFLGSLLDQPAGSAPTVADFLGGELTAAVDGHACQTVSLVDKSQRNARGNVVFRVGAADQAAACRARGGRVTFVVTGAGDQANPSALSEMPEYVAGVVQLIQNYGPEPPHREPRPPLIYE